MGRFANVKISENKASTEEKNGVHPRTRAAFAALGIRDIDVIKIASTIKGRCLPVAFSIRPVQAIATYVDNVDTPNVADLAEFVEDVKDLSFGVTRSGEQIMLDVRYNAPTAATLLHFMKAAPKSGKGATIDGIVSAMNAMAQCPACNGSGEYPGSRRELPCVNCLTSGEVPAWYAYQRSARDNN